MRTDASAASIGFWIAWVVVAACGCGRPTADQTVNNVLLQAGKSRDNVFPLAGRVAIDSQAPELKPAQRLIVMLHDPAKLDAPQGPALKTTCKPNGEFAFSTYVDRDGAPAGKYVVTFVVLRQATRMGHLGPDGLKNL